MLALPAMRPTLYVPSGGGPPKTPPAFRSFSTLVDTQADMVVSKPAGTANLDYLVCGINNYDDASATMTPPAGWTLLVGPTRQASGLIIGSWIYGKPCGPSEPASYTFSNNAFRYTDVIMAAFTGVDLVTPISTGPSGNDGTASPRRALSVTTDQANELLVLYSTGYNEAPTSTPTGMTSITVFDGVIAMYYEVQALAGASGVKDSTISNTDSWTTQMIALRPA